MLRSTSNRLRNKPGTEDTRRALVEDALKLCLHFAQQPGSNPAARLRAARANNLAGELQQQLGEHKKAVASYECSRELYHDLIDKVPRKEWQDSDYDSEELQVAMRHWSALQVLDPKRARTELDNLLTQLEKPAPEGADLVMRRRFHAALLANRAGCPAEQSIQSRR